VDVATTKKKPVWHFSEVPPDAEVSKLMPGFEIQYVITDEHCERNSQAVFGHCVFPPESQHSAHRHTEADELVYVVKGRVVNGQVDENGTATEYECGPGTATFVSKGRIHWTRNPFDEPAEFVFAYYGASSLEKSGLVDLTKTVPIENKPVSGTVVLPGRIDPAPAEAL
jgi:oxalate decarboxylase/phosphoglucose isomerase-like protein (cupin superfamily)